MVPELPDIALNGWYSQTQVARLLGVSYDSVHNWIKQPGGLKAEYSKRTGYAAQKKYRQENTKTYSFSCVKTTDADIIEQLEKQKSRAGYIKKLIRDDISRGN